MTMKLIKNFLFHSWLRLPHPEDELPTDSIINLCSRFMDGISYDIVHCPEELNGKNSGVVAVHVLRSWITSDSKKLIPEDQNLEDEERQIIPKNQTLAEIRKQKLDNFQSLEDEMWVELMRLVVYYY